MRKRLRKKVRRAGACVVCGRPRRYVAPRSLCTRHWMAWWNRGLAGAKPRYEWEDDGCYLAQLEEDAIRLAHEHGRSPRGGSTPLVLSEPGP